MARRSGARQGGTPGGLISRSRPRARAAAKSLAPALASLHLRAAFTSPAQRAVRTAELAGLDATPDPDLQEWDYGGYEGLTTAQIRDRRPGWYLWRDGVIPGGPGHPGENVGQVGARADRVLERVRPLLAEGNVALVAHAHFLRILAARWLGLAGRRPSFPAGHRDPVHPGHRARPAGHADVERGARARALSREGQRGLSAVTAAG